ncbi:MAG: hypothetical protein WCH99_08915 [Verrucomicrobiota bacterium]
MSNPIKARQNLISTTACNVNMDGLATFSVAQNVTLADVKVEENGRNGSESTVIYTGTYSALKYQKAICRGKGVMNMSTQRQSGGSLWQLTAVFPYNVEYNYDSGAIPVVSTYELDVEMTQPSIYSCPKIRGTYDAFGNQISPGLLLDKYIAAVARIVSNFESGDYSMTAVQAGGGTNTDAGWNAAIADIKAAVPTTNGYQARALQLFATVAAHKTDSFIEYYHVFKRTITAAMAIQIQASNIGKGQVFTSFEMAALEGVGVGGFFNFDTTTLWLKSPPVVSVAARQKTTITYHYTEFKQANGLIYTAYGNAVLKYASVTDLPQGV